MRPWAIKTKLLGATTCCQNAPVAIRHKDKINYINSYICRELSFRSYFTCFHNKYQSNSVSLCPYVCYVLVTLNLYCENCPRFIWNCSWFMPNPHEPGAILKYKSPLVLAGLFQGLNDSCPKIDKPSWWWYTRFIGHIVLEYQIDKLSFTTTTPNIDW